MAASTSTCRVRYVWVPDTRYTGRMPPRYAGAMAYGKSRYAGPLPGSAQRGVGAWFKVAPGVVNGMGALADETPTLLPPEHATAPNSVEFSAQGADLISGQDVEHHQQFFQ